MANNPLFNTSHNELFPLALLKDYSVGFADLFLLVEKQCFAENLQAFLKKKIDFDLMNGFYYSSCGKAFDLYNIHQMSEHQIFVQSYLAGSYILDPFYNAILSCKDCRLLIMRDIAPDNFLQTEYYQRHYTRTKIGDEIGITIQFSEDYIGILSFSRLLPNRSFSNDDIALLSALTPIISAFCQKHWSKKIQQNSEYLSQQAFSIHHPRLTQREIEIVTLILKGFSSQSIASLLGISPNTIKVHRKQIYSKLNISSQIELFHLFFSKNIQL